MECQAVKLYVIKWATCNYGDIKCWKDVKTITETIYIYNIDF